MATKAANIESIEKAFGEPWAKTRQRLEAAGGASASHKELADALYPQFDGVVDKHGWWVQGAVVAYEQEIGRRVPGQRADGTFDVAVSRTIEGDRNDIIDRFAALVDGSLNGIELDGDHAPPRRPSAPSGGRTSPTAPSSRPQRKPSPRAGRCSSSPHRSCPAPRRSKIGAPTSRS